MLLDASDPLVALGDLRTVRRHIDAREVHFVKLARDWGHTWAEIAATAGLSRQAAWERWRELDDSAHCRRG